MINKMKGIELAKAFYLEYGEPMLKKDFADKLDRIAVGIVGHGSECFGYDDINSQDHDFDAGFSIWLTEEDEKDFGFKLFRAYSKLPKEFMGIKTQETTVFGSSYKGVHTIKDFYSFYIPNGEVPTSNREWLSIPDFYLAEGTNGQVFCDNLGEFTKIRNQLLNDRPEDVRLKKLGSAVFNMAQSGQYNYSRCIKHNEKISAAVALSEFVKNTASAIFLLNKRYAPYYKWLFRAMRELPILGNIYGDLERLMQQPYNQNENEFLVEKIAQSVAQEIRNQGLSQRTESYLEGYAYCINDNIKDGDLRNLPIML